MAKKAAVKPEAKPVKGAKKSADARPAKGMKSGKTC